MTTVNYYDLKLEWLSIPNKILDVGYGGNLSAYPYIYLELYNEGFINTSSALVSNNPNSVLAIFKIPIDRYLYNIPKYFYTLKCNNTQTILIRPDQTMKLVLKLPNGQIIHDTTLDNTSPSPPNPLLQVNMSLRITPVK
jgi:hypothetical protein